MRYWTDTITEDTGTIERFENIPFADKFELEKRLLDPHPFAPNEWHPNARAYFDDTEPLPIPWHQCDNFTFFLYPVVSPRLKTLLHALAGDEAIEFLPVQLQGIHSGVELGTYYIPHLLLHYDCLDHELIAKAPDVRLFRERFPAEAKVFLAPDPVHRRMIFRDDVVEALRRAGVRGLGFYEVEVVREGAVGEPSGVPLIQLFFATPDEQRQWA